MQTLRAILLLGLALITGSADAAPDPAAIAGHVRAALARDRVPGAAVAVVWRGEVILLEGFGRDGRGAPVTQRTGFRLGSMSKAFTALAVMRSVEAGQLSLDAPVQAVLPDFALADRQAASGITLSHLLAHASGIPRTAPRAAPDESLREHVAALATAQPAARPGEQHIYSSPNYLVAARMLEVSKGRPFADILSASVLEPLGMTGSRQHATGEAGGRLAPGHRYWFGFPVPARLPEEPGRLATAGVVASAADMARFLRFQLGDGSWEGQRLLSPAGMEAMHRGTIEGDAFRYAMGWRDGRIGTVRAVHHGGILPDFRGKMILLPDRDAAVVVLTNASTLMPLPAVPTSHRLADAIAAHLAGEPLASPRLVFGDVVLLLWVGFGLLLAAQVGTVWRRFGEPGKRPVGRWRGIPDLAVALALAAGPPFLFGLSWKDLWTGSPDLVLWSLAMATLVFAAGARDLVRATGGRWRSP